MTRALVVLLVLALAHPAAAQPPVLLRVSVLPFISYGPFYIAREEGYFARQGIEVEFVRAASAAEIMLPLARGQLDVGAGSLSATLVSAVARGLTVKIVAERGEVQPGCSGIAMMVRSDLAQGMTLAALRGKIVNIRQTATFNQFLLERALAQAKLGPDDVSTVQIPDPALLSAFQRKIIDVASGVGEPWVTILQEAGVARVFRTAFQLAPREEIAFMFYGPRLLRDRALGQRFMVAYLQGARQYNQGKTDRNVEILARYAELEPGLVRRMCWHTLSSDGRITYRNITFLDWLYGRGMVETKVPGYQLLDTSFVEVANRLLTGSR